jgi:hypothetical protein
MEMHDSREVPKILKFIVVSFRNKEKVKIS